MMKGAQTSSQQVELSADLTSRGSSVVPASAGGSSERKVRRLIRFIVIAATDFTD